MRDGTLAVLPETEVAAVKHKAAPAAAGTVWGTGISENVVWHVVSKRCNKGELANIAPHEFTPDLR